MSEAPTVEEFCVACLEGHSPLKLVCDYRPAEAAIALWRQIVWKLEKPAQVQACKLYMDLSHRFRVDADMTHAKGATEIGVVARPGDGFLELMAAVATGNIDKYVAKFHGGSL